MRMVTSGVRWWFCQEEPSAKTTRKQTWVFAPISSIVFLNCLFMVSLECRCARRDLDSFLLQIEVAGDEGGRELTSDDGRSPSVCGRSAATRLELGREALWAPLSPRSPALAPAIMRGLRRRP